MLLGVAPLKKKVKKKTLSQAFFPFCHKNKENISLGIWRHSAQINGIGIAYSSPIIT